VSAVAATVNLLQNFGLANNVIDDLLHRVVSLEAIAGQDHQVGSPSAAQAHPLASSEPSPAAQDQAVAQVAPLLQSEQLSAHEHFPLFDAAAQQTLLSFLSSHPQAAMWVGQNGVTIYDGMDVTPVGLSTSVTLQTWEIPNGLTIALVGHLDHPSIA
jgi:hypothetical protein